MVAKAVICVTCRSSARASSSTATKVVARAVLQAGLRLRGRDLQQERRQWPGKARRLDEGRTDGRRPLAGRRLPRRHTPPAA